MLYVTVLVGDGRRLGAFPRSLKSASELPPTATEVTLRLPRWGYPMKRGPCSEVVALQRLLLKEKGMRFPAGLGRRVFKPKNRAWCVQAGKPPSSYISVMQGAASEMMTSSSTRYLGLHLSCLVLVGEMARCKMQDVRLTAKGQPQSAPGPASCPG